MKKTLSALALLFICTFANAQDVFYTHDGNGNRIIRETMLLKTNHPGSDSTLIQDNSKPEVLETYLLGNHISIYPNPTAGIIVLETEDAEALVGAEVHLLDGNGRHIIKQNVTGQQTEIDLSANANGTYIVRLIHQGRIKEWRVVKM